MRTPALIGGVSAFIAGTPIGTAHVNTWFHEPDR
jgi:hypothetical protein